MAFVELGGRRVEYEQTPGDPGAPALVFLHEGLGSVGLWRGFPSAVAAATGRRALVYSRFGHGDSDPPRRPRDVGFMHEEALDVLPALLAALDVAEPVLVGHSDGASIALIHAGAHAVGAVVAIAPHVFVEEDSLAAIRRARETYEHGDLRPRMARHHRDPDVAFYGWSDAWLDPAFRGWDIRDAVRSPVRCSSSRATTTPVGPSRTWRRSSAAPVAPPSVWCSTAGTRPTSSARRRSWRPSAASWARPERGREPPTPPRRRRRPPPRVPAR